MTLREALRGVRWYFAELTGETEYDRYVAHCRSEHPDAAVPTRREYERHRHDRRADPGTRCC